jgi:hypothetical protein
MFFTILLLTLPLIIPVTAARCSSTSASTAYAVPSIASGYTFQVLRGNFRRPRHIVFDTLGNLLVSGGPNGIVGLRPREDKHGCIEIQQEIVVNSSGLNHGLSLSRDGKTL